MSKFSLSLEQLHLPSPPAVAVRILELVRREKISAGELGQAIALDPALTARILRIANSSYYSFPEPVASVNKAVDLLGTRKLASLALSFSLVKSLRRNTTHTFDHDFFWRRSITAAVAGTLLDDGAVRTGRDIFATALLMDIGVLVMHLSWPGDYGKVFDEKLLSRCTVVEAEQKVFGFDHKEVGARTLQAWGLPASITEPIRYHHAPQASPREHFRSARILLASDRASAIYHGNHTNNKLGDLRPLVQDIYGNAANPDMETFLDEVGRKTLSLLSVFDIPAGKMKPYSELLGEAREEMKRLNLSSDQVLLELAEERRRSLQLSEQVRNAHQRMNEHLAVDSLTGLYNERFFAEMLDREMDRTERYDRCLSLLRVDVDFFRKVNETYGYSEGDAVLHSVGALLKSAIRISDSTCRLYGEAFALLLPDTEVKGATQVADRIRTRVEDLTIQAPNRTIKVTVSIGLAFYRGGERNAGRTEIMAAAEQALRHAKTSGRNRLSVAILN